MKIQCDVYSKKEAYVFCTSDEAALCHNCDNRVHNANKLASKHPRFPLVHPQESPCCDICQFCQEDRARLCLECDNPIHKANEYTKKQNRFLLSGVKISGAASSYQAAGTGTSSSGINIQPNSDYKWFKIKPTVFSSTNIFHFSAFGFLHKFKRLETLIHKKR
ncbi:hypothetical protein RD792_002206 [Penstemon davidsonii]|uniref:B box-type domain-containing protein n=1 Tax=Penstemon davidsonii TaxID=160366 RepID=A0ABR0DRH2_9LAMI|nr:hypothetical protein RD792_002206 [Penstemon davidsonii]